MMRVPRPVRGGVFVVLPMAATNDGKQPSVE